jgi:hypothetical protein
MKNAFNFHPEPVHNFTPAQAVIIILRNVRRQSPATRARWATSKNDTLARRAAKRVLIRDWLEAAAIQQRRTPKA